MKSLNSKLKDLRTQKGLSLKQLGIKAGCSASYLSMVENGQVDPSISRLKAIAAALGCTIIDLFSDEIQQNVVIRKSQRNRIEFPQSKTAVEPLIPTGNDRQLDARLAIIYPGGSSEGYYRHAGYEFGIILQGKLELIIENVEYLLNEGDSFFFPSTQSHKFNNPGIEDTIVVWVNHPASF
jgi:transcriptional regulator with XRE-family HTH domain